jgi:hypothetical protein
MSPLHDALLAAHKSGDKSALVTLYSQAADTSDDVDAACFFLTHAYIFALETNHPDTSALYQRLNAYGRV